MHYLWYISVEFDCLGIALAIDDFASDVVSPQWGMYMSIDPEIPKRIARCFDQPQSLSLDGMRPSL